MSENWIGDSSDSGLHPIIHHIVRNSAPRGIMGLENTIHNSLKGSMGITSHTCQKHNLQFFCR